MELLNDLLQPLTVVGCLIFGYVMKHYIPTDNKHIPATLAVVGILISVALNGYVSTEVTLIGGALSGLASTGLHQAFKNFINKDETDTTYNELNERNGK